jgi:hypothetical protein
MIADDYRSDFVNPGLLGSYSTFKKEFENPILKSRQPGVTKKDIEKGKARSEELARITSQFILRRTSEILSAYLPPKSTNCLILLHDTSLTHKQRNMLSTAAPPQSKLLSTTASSTHRLSTNVSVPPMPRCS